jgi:signal transduction histidine kinase
METLARRAQGTRGGKGGNPCHGPAILALSGTPLAGGDYLLTLADVTELKQAEAVLTQDRAALEQRVDERTRALTEANIALERARRDAEQATGAQRRFVAAASHDLVQPMHAARLFIGNALLSTPSPEQRALLAKADQAVEGAHRMLQALLTLSQLELGALQPRPQPVDAAALMRALAAEFEPVARARGCNWWSCPRACGCTATATCCARSCKTCWSMPCATRRKGGW